MKPYIKLYYDHYGYDYVDCVLCQVCGCVSTEIHHIKPKGMGGRAGADVIENLIALCRKCHIDAHSSKISKEELYGIINP
jgi:5-methylcytosine-specific restriction endonuclease McrA